MSREATAAKLDHAILRRLNEGARRSLENVERKQVVLNTVKEEKRVAL